MSVVYHCGNCNHEDGWYDAYVRDRTDPDVWMYYNGKTYQHEIIRRDEVGKGGKWRDRKELNDAVLCVAVYEKVE